MQIAAKKMSKPSLTEAFRQEMARVGLVTNDQIISDGKIHRIYFQGDKAGSKNGYYVLHGGGLPAGMFGSWKTGQKEKWCSKSLLTLTKFEREDFNKRMEEAREQREQEQSRIHAKARKEATRIWSKATAAQPDHPYLKKKGVGAYGLKQTADGRLLVPVRDTNVTLHGLQCIDGDGEKRFSPGTAKKGNFYLIGKPEGTIFICEGFATAASINQAAGEATVVAFDAGNLKPVAEIIRQKWPDIEIIIAADDDQWTDGNPGRTKGREAALAVGGKMAIPNFQNTDSKPTDFNDLHQLEGLEAVNQQLKKAVQPAADIEWPEIIPLPERGDTGQAADYDLELLPEAIGEAAAEVARFVKVPAMSPAVAGLSCMATAIGKKAAVIEKPGLEHYPALFFTMIADSGERKSPVCQNMARPLEQWAQDQKSDYEKNIRLAKATNQTIDAAITAVKNRAKKENANLEVITNEIADLEAKRIKEQPFPSLFTTDTTEQRLFQKMHDRGGAYAVLSGEGRPVLDAIMGKYSGDGRTGDAIYLAGISGDTITRDRVGGDGGPEERIIYQPCLNVCVFVQPDKYQEAASHPALRASGALARIWPICLPSLVGTRFEADNEPGLNLIIMQRFNDLVNQLLQGTPPKDETTGIACHKARLSAEAAEARREFHNTIERLMTDGGGLEDVRDIASKAVSQTVKLALVLHLAEDPGLINQAESTISLATWARAQALGTYHLQEAVRVQRMSEEDRTTHQARRLLEWIKREGLREVTARYISQFGPRPRLKAEQLKGTLDMLVDLGYLRTQKVEGKTKPTYIVNPALFVAVVAAVAGGHHEK